MSRRGRRDGIPANKPRRVCGQLKFFNYPWSATQPSAFGTPPDLKGRYALGLDYAGQPVYEAILILIRPHQL